VINSADDANTGTPLPRFAGVIFDLDGTLLDTLGDIAGAANSVLTQHGFPTHPLAAYREFVGDGVQVLMQRALPPNHRDDATLRACLKTMQVEYPRHLNQTARPYPGLPDVLTELRRRGLHLAVLSNKPDEFTARCVHDFFGRDTFDPILGLHPSRPRKPHPAGALTIVQAWSLAPAQILYVGDSGTDMETAVAAGVFPLGVLWGYRGEAELKRAGAKRLVQQPKELLQILSDPAK
jgi:phosphoglycolate phosphatase